MFSSQDNLSSILGWISIACWIVVYSPQIYENYSLQSGEGLSVLFVIVWLLGDLFNLLGAVLAGLLPTVILLAFYYSLCDIILLCQVYYYRWKRSGVICNTEDQREREPLLRSDNTPVIQQHVPVNVLVVRYTCALLFVISVGVSAWWLSSDIQETNPEYTEEKAQWYIQVLGWSSAVLYLGARIPQILKNFKTRCEGLSPALFFFAIFGNVTYAMSICAKSMAKHYLITNASWLAGSALTVFLDVFVLCQFFYYRYREGANRQLTGEI
ncbi:PQ loop repeat-domain-containing protein [Cyathus striatus]|nr:PQ loop repeat-domain-containing protein [Cyathus striatus]